MKFLDDLRDALNDDDPGFSLLFLGVVLASLLIAEILVSLVIH